MSETHCAPLPVSPDLLARPGRLRPSAPIRLVAMASEELSCPKNRLFLRPPMRHGSPYSKMVCCAKSTSSGKKNLH